MNTNTYTIQQYAAYKNVSVNTIRNWIKQKKVNATKKDNQWFITCTNADTNYGTNTSTNASTNDNKNYIELLQEKDKQIKFLKSQLEESNQARQRADTILMQLSQQIDRQQLQIEDMRRNRSIFARIREVFIPSNT
ncbi:MAG: helix-turn-helix domain-containing protein [Candidatus Poribacteria bacterium]|jgi:hypothetical protein